MHNKSTLVVTKRLPGLIARYHYGDLSEKERIELGRWVSQSIENKRLFRKISNKEKLRQGCHFIEKVNVAQRLCEIKYKGKLQFDEPAGQNHFLFVQWWRWIAAILLLLVILVAVLGIAGKNKKRTPFTAEVKDKESVY